MSPYQTIDLGTPYHDPTSPLYHHSLRSSRTTNINANPPRATAMTYASQLSPLSNDYFSHKPRSFLSKHADFDEKLAASSNPNNAPSTPDRGRKPSRLLGYNQPILQLSSDRPRVPLSRTLIRLLVLCTIVGLATLGWRCESVGCKGRGGGALVADYVGGGSVVAGWGTAEGMNLSAIWDKPSWGGERQGGSVQDGGDSARDVVQDEEGEFVGRAGSNEDEDGDGDVHGEEGDDAPQGIVGDAVQADGEEQQEVVQKDDAHVAHDQSDESYEAYASPAQVEVIAIAGPVGEMTGPDDVVVEAIAANAVAVPAITQQDAESDVPSSSQESDSGVATKASWLGSMDLGLF